MRQVRGKRTAGTHKRTRPNSLLACIDFGSELGRLYVPVKSRRDAERRREELIRQAYEFETKSLFIKECTSPEFLKDLAVALSQKMMPVVDFAAIHLAKFLFGAYSERLKESLNSDTSGTIVPARPFLKRRSARSRTVVFDPPPSFLEDLVDACKKLVQPMFDTARVGEGYNFWSSFTEWVWMNQMAQAMDQLENEIGTPALENMPAGELFNRTLAVLAESDGTVPEFARLADWHLREFVEMITSLDFVQNLSLHEFECLLGLVEPPGRGEAPSIQFPSVAHKMESLLSCPRTIHDLTPRAFEEVVAYGLEKSGYDVLLTPRTRDGGYDIEAFRYGPIKERILVECKHYAESRRVGRPILDALLGVLHREKANKAVLATTATFSKDALNLLKTEQWRLQGMDLDELLKFLRGIRQN